MSDRGFLVPVRSSAPQGLGLPRDGVLSAISELADHVRATGLSNADELLTELLAVLYTDAGTACAPASSDADPTSGTHGRI